MRAFSPYIRHQFAFRGGSRAGACRAYAGEGIAHSRLRNGDVSAIFARLARGEGESEAGKSRPNRPVGLRPGPTVHAQKGRVLG